MSSRPPIREKIYGLRQRRRKDGSWRVWWEPRPTDKERGFETVELDADKPTWSINKARQYADDAQRAAKGQALPARRGGRTIEALIHAYRQDPEFLDKKPATRTSYDKNLSIIIRKWGDDLCTDFTKPMMREWYLACFTARGPRQAVALIRMMSILFSFAELKGWRPEDSNPCFRLKMKTPPRGQRIATWDEVDALLDASAELGLPSVGTAILLGLLQGQRLADVIEAETGDFRQVPLETGELVWAWRVDRSKRGTLGMMQLHDLTVDRVTPLLPGRDATARLLTDDRSDLDYTQDLFWERWNDVRKQAAKTCPSITRDGPLQFRDLRRTFGVWARMGGAADGDVADVLGNTADVDAALQETYMPSNFGTASRAVLSIRAPEKRKDRSA
jgi:integrase